jgi:hypothetical protein
MNSPRTLLNEGSSILCSLGADDLTRSFSLPPEDAFTYNALTSQNVYCSGFYSNAYSSIHEVNIIIGQLAASTVISDSTRQRLKGELELVRAVLFFYLVNLYGDVPLVLSSDYTVTDRIPRTAAATVYRQITTDLLDAQRLLPDSYRTAPGYAGDRTIPNRSTATAVLARVYCYRQVWDSAIQAATAVINDGQYTLEEDLGKVFLSSSREAIWQLQSVNNRFTQEALAFIPVSAGLSKPTYTLTSTLLSAFEPADQRKAQWTNSKTVGGQLYVYPYKYKINTNTAAVTEYTTVIRLSELYLIRAEARTQLGNLTEAHADLNIIRSRAELPPLPYTDQASLLTGIGHERQVEFFTEYGHRWLDLKRTGVLNTVLLSEKPGTWKPEDSLYPLPAQDLQWNPSLVQNPGY